MNFFIVGSDLEKTVPTKSVLPLGVVVLQRQDSQVERYSSRICNVWLCVVTAEVPVKPVRIKRKIELSENCLIASVPVHTPFPLVGSLLFPDWTQCRESLSCGPE